MSENIVMQITHECNPNEARFRAGDFLIGTENLLNIVRNQKAFPTTAILPDKYYKIKKSTVEDIKNSNNVKYHYISYQSPHHYSFTLETITKETALEKLSNINRIPIKINDNRTLKQVLNEDEQLSFLNDVAKYESECVLNGNWTTWTETNYKLPQINYYKGLKSDHERHIYANAIGQQYALNLLLSPISVLTDSYDLDCINTFFENTEFYFDDNINQDKNQDDSEYLTSLNIKELWLPAEHFEIENPSDIKTVNSKQYIKVSQINEALERYSFQTNRVYYDSDWWDNFLIKL